MTYRTCVDCVHRHGSCQEKDRVRRQVAGLAVTSLKWKCKWHRLEFLPGDPVIVEIIERSDDLDEYGESVFEPVSYAGHVVQNKGSRLVCFITPDVCSEDGGWFFEPKNNGFVKVPRTRVKRREGVRESVCKYCRNLFSNHSNSDCWSINEFNPNPKFEAAES